MKNIELLKSFKIPNENLPKLLSELKKLNKKAKKINCPEIICTIKNEVIEWDQKSNIYHKYSMIDVIGQAPKYNDWQFIAKLDHDYKNPVLTSAPGVKIPNKYYNHSNTCDHCNHKRYRRNTYIIQNKLTGQYKHIGSACLKDFLGHQNPHHIAKWFTYITDFNELVDELNNNHVNFVEFIPVNDILKISTFMISKYGYVSNSKAAKVNMDCDDNEIIPTSDHVLEYLYNPKIVKKCDDIPNQTEIINAAINNVKTMDQNSDYVKTLNSILEEKFVKARHIGYVVSIIGVYLNKIEKEKEITENKLNEWFGEIKKRIDHQVKIISISTYDTEWGIAYRIKMIDDKGRLFVWFASNLPYDEFGQVMLIEDQSYILKMTIKNHSEYKGRKQTIVNRCKIVKQLS